MVALLIGWTPQLAQETPVSTNPLITESRDRTQSDQRAAVAHAEDLTEEVLASSGDGTRSDWALIDPDGFLAYVRSQDRIDHLLDGLVDALTVVPEQVLIIAAEYPSTLIGAGRTLEEAAIVAVTEQTPAVAKAYLDGLVLDDRHRRLRGAFAEAWARRNPEEALLWAEGLEPAAPGVVATVIGWTAATDVDAALNLLESFDVPGNHPAVLLGVATPEAISSTIVRQIASDLERTRIADMLLQRRTSRSLIALQELTSYWAQVDLAAATTWVTRAVDALPPELPTAFVSQFAATNAVAAMAIADQLPRDIRLLVAGPISRELARTDPFSAARWIEQFQEYGQYRDLYLGAFDAAATEDPESASAMLASVPPVAELRYDGRGLPMRLEGRLAEAWAHRDLPAAAAWLQGITDPAGLADAVRAVTSYWLKADPEAAQEWALSLPRSDARRRAVEVLVYEAAMFGYAIAPRVVRAYGLEPEQQEMLGGIVAQVEDTTRALSLAGEWISDPEIQRQTVQRIESVRQRYSIVVGSSN